MAKRVSETKTEFLVSERARQKGTALLANVDFMGKAIKCAQGASEDLPIGCVIVKDGTIIGRGCNKKEELQDATLHAEMVAIQEASKKLGEWRLDGCKMYVTLEPCPMCMWAILNARIDELYFGAYDYNYGAAGSKLNLVPLLGSKIKITGGIKEKECEEILKNYFAGLRHGSRRLRAVEAK